MASNSPGVLKKKKYSQDGEGQDSKGGLSGFIGSVFGKSRRSGRKNKEEARDSDSSHPSVGSASRVEVAYYGKRTDARDRSSEDPRRHRIPRAKSGSPEPTAPKPPVRTRSKLRKKSLERELGRRVSRERELEWEKRRERSLSGERLARLATTEKVTEVESEEPTQEQIEKALLKPSITVERSRSSASAKIHQRDAILSTEVTRQTSFKVARNIQVSKSFRGDTIFSQSQQGMPPIPPPRAPKSPQPTTDENATGATPKKTPYQFWREQRMQSTTEFRTSTPKPVSDVDKIEVIPMEVDHQEVESPKESADEILARWKKERSKRVRNVSGSSAVSQASSSTAEPLRKVALQRSFIQSTPASKPVKVSLETTVKNTEPKRDKKSSLSALFPSFSKKNNSNNNKSTNNSEMHSIKALIQSAAMSKDFHENFLHHSSPKVASDHSKSATEVPAPEPQVVHGTILRPVPPRSTKASRTPFEEWRHYRGIKDEVRRVSDPQGSVRQRTPDPDYDNLSTGSAASSRSSVGVRYGPESSHEDLHRLVGPQYYSHHPPGSAGYRSVSAMGIPRYVHRPKTSSLLSASPRLERAFDVQPSTQLGSAESQQWYNEYSHEAFPHEAEFGATSVFGVQNYDGRIHSIKGVTLFHYILLF